MDPRQPTISGKERAAQLRLVKMHLNNAHKESWNKVNTSLAVTHNATPDLLMWWWFFTFALQPQDPGTPRTPLYTKGVQSQLWGPLTAKARWDLWWSCISLRLSDTWQLWWLVAWFCWSLHACTASSALHAPEHSRLVFVLNASDFLFIVSYSSGSNT